MLRIQNDPNLNVYLDYAVDVFINIRTQLVNDDTTEDQAMQLLQNIWEANNNAVKILWQQQEEKKKNKHKFIPILEEGIPDDPVITPCSYAPRKLNKGEYVELWYFTNDGLDEANTKKTIDDDAMILSTLADSSMAWVSSASTWSRRVVVNDENLPFKEFCQACPCFLVVIEEVDWPEDRVCMIAHFWLNIQVHKYWSL
ncbi:uncharacterized protein BJ212DRAFT_1303044 [Suillus subaureus]|uniref:Uncharacterized protein n=1 Tax=Suillus subaureus TaxID=48587 RepID=A0A9P7E1L2_9AGAM|nr:uncharacterized protein BJ212DRAFT_1303044 [Suillus subaureus]KAG1808435.1 hypothetical protein BJ212DRAFT_1303044 [Suillus subaureus]